MKKETHYRKITTRVSESEFKFLQFVCERYGFRSVYEVMQTMLRTLIKWQASKTREEEEESIALEVQEMFDDFTQEQPRTSKSYTTVNKNYHR